MPGLAHPPRVSRPGARAWNLFVALVAGLVHTAAFAPVGAWWLQIGALALVFWRLRTATTRQAGWLGVGFGLGWLGSGLWWLYISMHRYGGMPAGLAVAAVVLLALLLSIYTALAFAAFARWRRDRPMADILLFAAVWLAAELARASWLSGFPWLASGYAHTTGPLAAWAPWMGVYGIGALAAGAAAALATAISAGRGGRRAGVAPAVAMALLVAAGQLLPQGFTRSTGRLTVSLLQPNVAQDLKFDTERMAINFERLAHDVAAARGALVVTPESVVPLPLSALDPAQWRRLHQAVSSPGRAALVGIFMGDDVHGYVNSMVGLSAASDGTGPTAYVYGKQHLLPFGEVIPFGFRWFVRAMNIPLDDQAQGRNSEPLTLGAQRLRPLICYEDLFGEDIVGSAVGGRAATIFVNASNLAWFGTRMVQDQHLQFSRMRALEFERPFIRSTNTGATTVIDHQGQVVARLPAAEAGTLESEVEGRIGDTPYAAWLSRAGLWPLWAAAALVIGLAAWRRR